MKFSKGLIVALCAVSTFSFITPSSYLERAKAKAQSMYGQAKDAYGQVRDKYGNVISQTGQMQDAAAKAKGMYGKAKNKYQDLRSKAIDYYYTPSKADRDKEQAMMREMDEAAYKAGITPYNDEDETSY